MEGWQCVSFVCDLIVVIDPSLTGRYEGEWADGKKHGKAAQEVRTRLGDIIWGEGEWKGDVYEGDWVQDHRDGEGKYMWANGDVYRGRWERSKINGRGTKVRLVSPTAIRHRTARPVYDVTFLRVSDHLVMSKHIVSSDTQVALTSPHIASRYVCVHPL